MFVLRDPLSRPSIIKNACGLFLAAWSCVTAREPVIGKSPAVRVEVVMTLFKSVQKVLQRANVGVAGLLQAGNPAIEFIGCVNLKGPVGTESGIDPESGPGRLLRSVDSPMRAEIVTRVVGRTQRADAEFVQNAAGAQIVCTQQCISSLPNRLLAWPAICSGRLRARFPSGHESGGLRQCHTPEDASGSQESVRRRHIHGRGAAPFRNAAGSHLERSSIWRSWLQVIMHASYVAIGCGWFHVEAGIILFSLLAFTNNNYGTSRPRSEVQNRGCNRRDIRHWPDPGQRSRAGGR